jgi:D-3-phosphoglycerate dehydrogenase
MKNYKILVTFRTIINFLKKNKKKLPKNFKFNFYNVLQGLKANELKKKIKYYDGLICGDDEINEEVLKEANKLKVISKWGTGLDSINLNLCKKYKVKVFNTPGAFTESVAQLAMAFILGFSREIFQTHFEIKKNNWPKITGRLLKNQILGIVGFGKIGSKLANYANKFKMKIIFYDIKKINNKKYKQVSLNYLLQNSDYICLCCDLNETSIGIIGFDQLKLLKKNSSLINVARGRLIKENDLLLSLKRRLIKNVALDVFENEPLKKSSRLRKYENVILSSHNAFNTFENVKRVNENTLNNLLKVLK